MALRLLARATRGAGGGDLRPALRGLQAAAGSMSASGNGRRNDVTPVAHAVNTLRGRPAAPWPWAQLSD